MKRAFRGAALPCVLLLLTACGERSRASGPVVRDSAGVRIVENTAPAWREGGGWSVAPEPSLDIGVVDGAPEYQLNRVAGALRLPDGRVLLANGGSRELRFFDAGGRHLRSVGGEGSGPGEFRAMGGFALSGDSLLVFDPALQRLTAYDLQGSRLGDLRVRPTGDPTHPLRLYRLAGPLEDDGLLLLPRAFPADMRPQPTVLWDTVPNLLYGRTGELRDTVGEFSGMDLYATPEVSGPITFGRFTSSHLHRDELYITDGGRYEVRVYGADGALRRVVRVLHDPRLVTPADVDAFISSYLARAPDENARAEIRRRFQERPRAEHKPWISAVLVDDLGHLWVREYRPPWERAVGPDTWSVFDPEGRLLGAVAIPGRFQPTQIGGDFVLGVWRDELDVEHIRMYALQKPA